MGAKQWSGVTVILMACLRITCLDGQISRTDSLQRLLITDIHDTVKLRIRATLGEELPVLRLGYWDSVKNEGLKWRLKKYAAEGINNMGYIYDNLGDVSKAIQFYSEGLKIREEIGDRHGIAESLNNIAYLSEKQGDVPRSLEFHNRALKIQEEIGDREGMGISLNNIATIYEYQNDTLKALEYYQKSCLIASQTGNKESLATSKNNIGRVYYSLSKQFEDRKPGTRDSLLSNAMLNYNAALSLFLEMKNERAAATLYQNIGMVFLERKDKGKAMEFFRRSLELRKKTNDKRGISNSYYCIGLAYYSNKNYSTALDNENKALAIGRELGFPKDILEVALSLSEIHVAIGNWHEAYRMQSLYHVMKDSIESEKTRKASLRQQFQYEYDKKESLLEAEREKEKAIAEEKSRRQRIIIWSSVGGLILVLLFSGFVLRSLSLTRKQKRIIEEKNNETELQKRIIEEKNKDITDSINYAKRIQNAKLPELKQLYSTFPSSFVLFRPKDIVSGYFYFFLKKDRYAFIAAAYCTGHGVPGAFMSLIGLEKLEDSIGLSPDSSEILKQLNNGIRKSLHQSQSEDSTRDGMDIAFCSVDLDNAELSFAGANRPFWFVRKQTSVIEEIPGTRKAIGGYTEENQEFASNTLRLSKGDRFYIFSDGYADTSNGNDGKKLKTKRFRQILSEIQGLGMPDQGAFLDDFIIKWKGKTEQVDDILVIGIEI